jgi:hypothetical protein
MKHTRRRAGRTGPQLEQSKAERTEAEEAQTGGAASLAPSGSSAKVMDVADWQLTRLRQLAESGSEMAELLHRDLLRADAEAAERDRKGIAAPPDAAKKRNELALAFKRVSQSVRHTIALAAKIEAERPQPRTALQVAQDEAVQELRRQQMKEWRAAADRSEHVEWWKHLH